MPFLAALTPAAAALIGGGATAGATAYGAHVSGKSADKARQSQDRATAESIAFERERENTRRQEKAREDAEAQKQWEAEQAQKKDAYDLDLQDRLYNRSLLQNQEARRAPYRAAGAAALQNLGQMLGLNFDASAYAAPQMPEPGPSGDDQKALSLLGTLRSGLDPTSANLGTLITGLNKAGIKATRARHANNTLDSDDKIVLPSGYITDQIFDVGGSNARWT